MRSSARRFAWFQARRSASADLVSSTERLLEKAVLDALAMAGKAGLVAAGFTKAENALATWQEVVGLIHAAEAAPDGVRKLDARGAGIPARPSRCDWIPDLGAIGFGIGAPKCGTCSPACRTCERHVFGAFAAP
jgi:hypothetical protein